MKKSFIGILGIILAAITFAGGAYFGGSGSETVPCMSGGKCKVDWDSGDGIQGAIKDCDFKKLGDKCVIKLGADVEYIEEGTTKDVENLQVKPDKKTEVDTKVKPESTKSPEQINAVIPEETKIPDSEKEKEKSSLIDKNADIPDSPTRDLTKPPRRTKNAGQVSIASRVFIPKNFSGLPPNKR